MNENNNGMNPNAGLNQENNNGINPNVETNQNNDNIDNTNNNTVQQEDNNKKDKSIKSLTALLIIGLVLSIIRIPHLLEKAGAEYNFMDTDVFSLVMLVLGAICIVAFVLSLIFKNKNFIINIISGILLFVTGSIIGNIIGILIIIDSIRTKKTQKQINT
ncbi:MAG: hypothetical protein IKE63_05950 [Bacilli bacterium]|nr:hypothetical protein [Bacilli bacterium]